MRSVNYAELEIQAMHELLQRKSRQESREDGFIIDDSCYPPVAYKGPRFQPTSWHVVPTEAEQALLDSVRDARAEKADLEIKAGVFTPAEGFPLSSRCFECGAPEIDDGGGEIQCSRPGCTHD